MKTVIQCIICCFLLLSCREGGRTAHIFGKPLRPHPRLLFVAEDAARLEVLKGAHPLLDRLRADLPVQAEKLLNLPLQTPRSEEMLNISREQVYRMITLSLAFRLTEDTRFAVKAEEELNHVCDFPDWHPEHYLDVAEMTAAVAIGYDWLYSILTPETKRKIVSSIKTKALDLVVEEYRTGDENSWAKRETNWNVVCNTGMVLGALAVADHYPDLCRHIVENAVKYVPNCVDHYAPDGVCYEGPAYWGYTNIYLSLLLKSLNDNFGNDFGLSILPGVEQAVLYYIHALSPSGKVFNFANSGDTSPDTNPIYFYFSRKFNQSEAAAYYRGILSEKLEKCESPRGFYFLSIPWFDPAPFTGNTVPKLNVYTGINDIVVFNGDRSLPGHIYLIAKTGDPDRAHQQLDVGTFIVETDSIRWSDDLGADYYSLPGFWEYKPGGRRWNYFRNTNFSHNTLAIDGKLQYSEGRGEIESYNLSERPEVVMNLSGVYKGQAESVRRKFLLSDDTQMIITDSVALRSASQRISWSMITAAQVECRGNTAVLSKDGKNFYLEIISPAGASFAAEKAKVATAEEKPLEGYTLISTTVSGKREQVIRVRMSKWK
ncbi:MAG: heparinase II/III family protein [Tannerella sp.]|jgi:hypothetical protein|nr:heparinase II/III family protein [Tannerella sp.]